MENLTGYTYDPNDDKQPVSGETAVFYPPKYQKKDQPANVWMRSVISLALYLVLGYYIFHSFMMLLVITAIVILHEMGHFLAMKYYRYNDLGIFFIPLLGAYVSGTKREVSQKESAVILLAGPLPGIILGIILYFLDQHSTEGIFFYHISLETIAILMLFLNIINLIPVYPLDGGQLLNRVFLDEEGWVSKIFVFLSIGFMIWAAVHLKFYPLLIFPGMMLLRFFTDSKYDAVEKQIETEGINVDSSYQDLRDEDYWKIRDILITKHGGYKEFIPGPPYEYSPKEEKIMTAIESLLHRHLIQDLSIPWKIFLMVLWIAAFISPWLFDLDMSRFSRFGF